MQQQIKFRTWSKEYKQWMNHCSVIDGDGHVLVLFYEQKENGQLSPIASEYPLGSVVVQQFTGLLDKNGKEIYEGDIVCHDSLNFPVNGEVVWLSEADGSDFSGWTTTKAGWGDGVSNTTVLGNIFENPELLSTV